MDVLEIRLVVGKSSVVVPSVVPDPDPESWKRFYKIILRTISTHLWNKLTNHPRTHFDLIVVIISRSCGRAVFTGRCYLDNSDEDKEDAGLRLELMVFVKEVTSLSSTVAVAPLCPVTCETCRTTMKQKHLTEGRAIPDVVSYTSG